MVPSITALLLVSLAGQDEKDADAKADAVIRGKAAPSEIVITTTKRLAGAIHSVTWNGKEFIDSTDHGRQLQSASSFAVEKGRHNAETYNPTEVGSRKDSAGPTSSSRLLELSARDNELCSKIKMAFWLAPGEKSEGDLARNSRTLSDHVVAKKITIGARGLPHAIEIVTTFTVPADEKAVMGQFESLTGYMPAEFRVFRKLNLKTGLLNSIDDGPGEQTWPLVFSTADDKFAMGILALSSDKKGVGKVGYGRWRFGPERVVKWNSVFRIEAALGIPTGDYTFRHFVGIGTLEDVRQTLMRLVGMVGP
jgi:hypothetical protein